MESQSKFVIGLVFFLFLCVMGQERHVATQERQETVETTCGYAPTEQILGKAFTFRLTDQFAGFSQRAVISEPGETPFKVKAILLQRKEWESFRKAQPHTAPAVPQASHPHGRHAIDYYIYTLRRIVI